MRRRAVAWLAALAACAVVAAIVLAARPVFKPYTLRAVINGGAFPTPGRYPYVTAVSSNRGACSGFLIDPLHVMTARHCTDKGYGKVGAKVYIGAMSTDGRGMYGAGGSLTAAAETRTVKSLDVYKGPPGRNYGTGLTDWAVCELDSPSTKTPVQLDGWQTVVSPSELASGETIAVGYGKMETGAAGRLQDAPVRVKYSGSGMIVSTDPRATTGVCYGDSGGPLVHRKNNQDVVIAIASSVNGKDCTKPHQSNWTPVRQVAENMKKSWSPTVLTQRLAKCALADRQGDKCPATHPWDSGGASGPKAPAGFAGKYCAQNAQCALDLFRLFVKNGAATGVPRLTK